MTEEPDEGSGLVCACTQTTPDPLSRRGCRTPKPIVGVSTCLLGMRVRYDGKHKRDGLIADTLAKRLRFVPVCPEVECGLGVPRESMHLVGDPDAPRLITTCTKKDMTSRLARWARKRLRDLEKKNLCGFIFKSDSPSCGMAGVPVVMSNGRVSREGIGLFARTFTECFPSLPISDERRLRDRRMREDFLAKITTSEVLRAKAKRERSRR